MKRNILRSLALAAVAAGLAATPLAAPAAFADKAATYTGFASNQAVGGYDPVAYFTVGRPVRGTAQFTTTYGGAEYRFSSAANLAAFRANPAHYAPAYGGYCAWAVSQGYTAPGNPNFWRIVNGRLYLNYNAQVQRDWERNIPGFITQANSNWPRVLRG
jgi:YHS domain-containing protein